MERISPRPRGRWKTAEPPPRGWRNGLAALVLSGLLAGFCPAADWRVVSVLQVSQATYIDASLRPLMLVNGGDLSYESVYFVGADSTADGRALQMMLTAIGNGFHVVIDYRAGEGGGPSTASALALLSEPAPFPATSLGLSGAATMTAGGSQTVTVTAWDMYHHPDASYSGDKSLVFSGTPGAGRYPAGGRSPRASQPPTSSDRTGADIPFGSPTVLTFSGGVAGTTMKLFQAGTTVVEASDGTLDPDPLTVTVSPAAKSRLQWASPPASPVDSGTVWPVFRIEIADPYGNRTADTDLVSLSPSSGTLSGATAVSAASGLATFDDIASDAVGTITVTGSSGSLTAVSQEVQLEPLAVRLLDFSAQARECCARLAWRTGAEWDCAGFHLWRGATSEGPWQRVTPQLIPSRGQAFEGAEYEWVDCPDGRGRACYFYRLEDIGADGVPTFHGPAAVCLWFGHRPPPGISPDKDPADETF